MPSCRLIPSRCYHTRMARSKETERSSDAAKLDKAIDAMLDVIGGAVAPTGDAEIDELNVQAMHKSKVEAAKALPGLFARRSALLGLDEAASSNSKPGESGTLAELERKLALVKS